MLGKISSVSDLLSKLLGTLVFIIIIITLQTNREIEVLMEHHSLTASHKWYTVEQDLNTAPSDPSPCSLGHYATGSMADYQHVIGAIMTADFKHYKLSIEQPSHRARFKASVC